MGCISLLEIKQSISVMKFFLAIFAVLAVANAQESCDLCKMGVDALGQYLMTEAEIAAVEEGLVDLVCSTLDEEQIQTCAEGVYTWWPSVTEALFNYEGTAVAICVGTGSCKYDLKQEVSCAQCEDWMGRVSGLLGTDEFANTVYNDLHGAVFCDDTSYVPAESTEECKGLMDLIGESCQGSRISLECCCLKNLCRPWMHRL